MCPHTILVASAGTRIIYDRKFLLDCRNSPIARTPPCCLPQIPGVTMPSLHPLSKLQDLKEELEEEKDLAGKLSVSISSLDPYCDVFLDNLQLMCSCNSTT